MSTRKATYTIYVCPKGHWHGAESGLWSKPSRCPRCITEIVARKPVVQRGYTTMKDVAQAPMTEAVEVRPA